MRSPIRAAVRAAVACVTAVALSADAARAQTTLLPTTGGSAVPIVSAWFFADAIAQPAGTVQSVAQTAVPMRVRFIAPAGWTVDFSTAIVSNQLMLKGSDSRTLTLSGLSDLTVRATGPVVGDRVLITAGINLPTGATGLSADETAVLQAASAPALGLPVPALGRGFGATLGLLAAREVGEWALALGFSAEQRTEYTPVSLAIASGSAETRIKPGTALHLSLGGDRSIGEHRLSVLLVSDGYAADNVTTQQPGANAASTAYTLGRQTSVLTRLELARDGWREFVLSADARIRAPFANDAGQSVDGSGGNYLEGSWTAVRGAQGERGLVLGLDVRRHGGLSFTDALVGAAVSAVGVSTGVDWTGDRAGVRIVARVQAGQFDTGTTSTTGVGFTLAGTLSFRGGDR